MVWTGSLKVLACFMSRCDLMFTDSEEACELTYHTRLRPNQLMDIRGTVPARYRW